MKHWWQIILGLALVLASAASAEIREPAPLIEPDAGLLRLDDIGMYAVGYAYRGQPEQSFPKGWSGGFDDVTGVALQSGAVQNGRLTCLLVVIYSMALLAVGPAAMVLGVTGWISAIFSMVLGSVMVAAALNLSRNKTRENARKLFFASIIYLPLLLIMMVADSSESGKLTALRSTQTTDQAQR